MLKAIQTSKGRDNNHLIILDDIDGPLSDNAAVGVADEIIDYCKSPSEHLCFFAITTHRRSILARFADAGTNHIRVGDELSLREVVNSPIIPIRPKELLDKSHALFKAMMKYIKT